MSSNQLTDARRIEVINEATQAWGRKDNDLLYLEVCRAIEREVAASPVEQPAAAPIDRAEMVKSWGEISSQMFAKMTPWQFYEAGWVASRAASTASSPACKRCGSTTAQACNDVGCFYLESGDGERAPSPADEWAAWGNARESLAVAMAGFASRSGNRDFNAALTVLDAITEPGLPLSWLRTARAASANETGAEGATVAWMRADDPRDCISDAKKRDMIERAGAPGARLAENYSIALGRIGAMPAMAAEAPEELPHWFEMFLTNVCELPDRNSPEGEPDAVIATLEELRNCALNAIEQCVSYAAPQPAQADARVGLTDEQRESVEHAATWLARSEDLQNKAHAERLRALLATSLPELRAEVTNPFRELLAALIDIYDDERNNAPEDRCYVEGAWSEVLSEARALLTPLPDPAQVAAKSPDWIKNALPPEGE